VNTVAAPTPPLSLDRPTMMMLPSADAEGAAPTKGSSAEWVRGWGLGGTPSDATYINALPPDSVPAFKCLAKRTSGRPVSCEFELIAHIRITRCAGPHRQRHPGGAQHPTGPYRPAKMKSSMTITNMMAKVRAYAATMLTASWLALNEVDGAVWFEIFPLRVLRRLALSV
jgi:hypothetical protein